jgi:hypothetical protein
MREHRIGVVIVKDFDLVLSKTAGSAKMEVARVFISEGAIFVLGPLPPVGGPITVNPAKLIFGKSAQARFQSGETPDFF